MKTCLYIILAILLIITPTSCGSRVAIDSDQSTVVSEVPISPAPISKPTVTYRTIDNSIYDSSNRLLAINTYQCPVVDGSQCGICKINRYYRDEVERYCTEANKQYFSDSVTDVVDRFGVDAVLVSPLRETSEVSATMITDTIISFKREYHWAMGGVSTTIIDGQVFDLETGEQLTVDKFVALPLAEFNALIISKLMEKDNFNENELTETINQFTFEDYSFYLDEDSLFICFNGGLYSYNAYNAYVLELDTSILQ